MQTEIAITYKGNDLMRCLSNHIPRIGEKVWLNSRKIYVVTGVVYGFRDSSTSMFGCLSLVEVQVMPPTSVGQGKEGV